MSTHPVLSQDVRATRFIAGYLLLQCGLLCYQPLLFFSPLNFLVILLLFATMHRGLLRFLRDWMVLTATILSFNYLRGAIYTVLVHHHLPIHQGYVIGFERIFAPNCGSISHILQAQLGQPRWLVVGCSLIYCSHFFYFFLIGFSLWLVRPHRFVDFDRAMRCCLWGGLCGYALLPTEPPWLAATHHAVAPVSNVFIQEVSQWFPRLVVSFDVNPVAAMPSLHMAFPAVCLRVIQREFSRGWSGLALGYCTLVAFATLYLGAHYWLDLVIGFALGVGCVEWVYRWPRRAYVAEATSLEVAEVTARAIAICLGSMLLVQCQ